MIFDISRTSLGGNPCLKKKSLEKMIQIKEKFNLCEIWRVQNPKIRHFFSIYQGLFKEDLFVSLLTYYKNLLIKRMC